MLLSNSHIHIQISGHLFCATQTVFLIKIYPMSDLLTGFK